MIRISCALAIGLLLFAERSVLFAAEGAAFASALETIQTDDVKRHVETLADDRFEGREAGRRGGRAAGVYLTKELARIGLPPGGVDGSWFQPFLANYRNVLAVLPGSDEQLKEQYILVGAHYDHVGYGSSRNSYGPWGYIHNGADDNASGTAALLELAEALKALPTAPKRSILLAFWDGEEKGLLGSKHWAAQPTIQLSQVALTINLDMVGRLRENRLEVAGTRTSWGLRRLVSLASTDDQLTINFSWQLKSNSDHWTFFQRNIPTLLLHTGLHDDYHRPSDDSEKINNEGVSRVTRLLFPLLLDLADVDSLPGFRRRAHQESPYTRKQIQRPAPSLPARLGVWWDEPATDKPGLRVSKIVPASPADTASLQIGDLLLEMNDQPLRNGDQLRSMVLRATESAKFSIQRDGEEEPEQITVELGGQPVRVGIAWRSDEGEPGTVFLTRVVQGSPADRAGLQILDHIYEIGGEDFADSDDFAGRLQEASDTVRLLFEREGQVQEAILKLPSNEVVRQEVIKD